MALILSNAADVDIADIAAYTIETWGIAQADIYIEGLIDAMNGLIAVPKMLAPAADLLFCCVGFGTNPTISIIGSSVPMWLSLAYCTNGWTLCAIFPEWVLPCHPACFRPYGRAGVGRTWSSPTWSGPDGSSHNDFAAGRSGSHRALVPTARFRQTPCLGLIRAP